MTIKPFLIVSSLKTLKPRVIGVFEDLATFERILKDYNLTEKELVKFKKNLNFEYIQIPIEELKNFYENKNITINTFVIRINDPYLGGITLMDKDEFISAILNVDELNIKKSNLNDLEKIKYLKYLYGEDFITSSFSVLNEYSSDVLKEEIELFRNNKYIIIERNLMDNTIQVCPEYFNNANKAKKYIKNNLIKKPRSIFNFNAKDYCFEIEHSINERRYLYQIYTVQKYIKE